MLELNYINTVIEESVHNGIYNIVVDLSQYTPDSGYIEIVNLPPELEMISFFSDNPLTKYHFRIVANEEREKDLEVKLENVYLYAGSNIGIDLRGFTNQNYINTIVFKGNNTIVSDNSIGILVTNDETMYITGQDSSSILNVNGGIRNCAIGNNLVINLGGKIIFNGTGNVKAVGGDGYNSDLLALSHPTDGAFGIGFAENTAGASAITIECSAQVETVGGNGQKCDSDDPNYVGCGNGGDGISLGENGILYVEECPNVDISLKSYGGNGGEIYGNGAVQNVRQGGEGGNAIGIVSGTVNISGSAVLEGGNGTSLSENDKSLPLKGGNGGSAVYFSGDNKKKNSIILGGNVEASGGDGGNSGVSLDFSADLYIASLDGGNGGMVIDSGNSPISIVLEDGRFSSGNGGDGGSPSVYGESIIGVNGADIPGNGGANGSIIHGEGMANLTKDKDAEFIIGIPGNGGTGFDAGSEVVKGSSGRLSDPIDISTNGGFDFGYINLKAVLDLQKIIENMNGQNNCNGQSCDEMLCTNKTIYISQNFDSCFSIDDICIQDYYDASNTDVITGNVIMMLLINSSIVAYKKTGVALFTKL